MSKTDTPATASALQILVDERLSAPEIAAVLACGVPRVRYWLKKHKMVTNPTSERFVKVSDVALLEAAKVSCNMSGLLTTLKLSLTGDNYSNIKRRLTHLGFDAEGFSGRRAANQFKANESVFQKGKLVNGRRLKSALLKSGVEGVCAWCGVCTWRGQPLTLQVDHVDGDRFNNLKSNLRLLCPNCHTQTDTYGTKIRPELSSASTGLKKVMRSGISRTPVDQHRSLLTCDS